MRAAFSRYPLAKGVGAYLEKVSRSGHYGIRLRPNTSLRRLQDGLQALLARPRSSVSGYSAVINQVSHPGGQTWTEDDGG